MAMFQGGGETYSLNIARGLKELGCEVNFIVSRPWFAKIKYPIQGFETEYVPSPYLRDISHRLMAKCPVTEKANSKYLNFYLNKVIAYIGSVIYRFDDRNSQHDIFCYLKKRKKDLDIVQIFTHVALAGRIAEELKKPVVIRFPGPPGKKKKEQILKCDAVIANGDAFNFIRSNITENVIFIPPGIDANKFKKIDSEIRNKYRIKSEKKLALFVGRFVPFKNIPFLINGMAEIIKQDDRVKLMLVGEGPLYSQIKNIVSDLKIENNVIFTGRVSNDVLPEYYSAADIFVITSNYDNFPNAVIEAMACGLPVVGTAVGGIPTLVEEGINGFCIENNNVEQFRDAVLKLINDESLCREIGERNREIVKVKYDWRRSAEQFLEIYKEVLERRTRN